MGNHLVQLVGQLVFVSKSIIRQTPIQIIFHPQCNTTTKKVLLLHQNDLGFLDLFCQCWYSNNKHSPIHHNFYGWDSKHRKLLDYGIAIPKCYSRYTSLPLNHGHQTNGPGAVRLLPLRLRLRLRERFRLRLPLPEGSSGGFCQSSVGL